ncbi:hypothetical protein SAMN04489712_104134 [Thermomonospora echinospora]|uniref:Uncharacterized protein n=1 Tax=Thermomonospora echinospora TaxID=1992 RepID=A0A1H5YSF3_9ACTN|nr:hypothetical protein [Thermomonospora echinospora]SEG26427.1 hypothetical protein SAMN04489712_104134 [Thermomonospora echinospora]
MISDDTHSACDQVRAWRRAAYTYLRRYAAIGWTMRLGEDGWNLTTPPALNDLPPSKRLRKHARQEAERLSLAHQYLLCPLTTATAVAAGAHLREDRHTHAQTQAGRPNVVDTAGITPPTPFGFVCWQDPCGIGYNLGGAPILACHWGRLPRQEGTWLAWWADGRATLHAIKTTDPAARQDKPWARAASTVGWWTHIGPLYYDYQQLLRPHDLSKAPGKTRHDKADQTDPSSEEGIAAPDVALIYTTVATWQLLNDSATVHLTEYPPSPAEATADLTAGLTPRPLTLAAFPNQP